MATNEQFVIEWQRGNSIKEVATTLGMTTQAASSKAMHLRKSGVPLKKYDGGRPPVDVVALRALCK